MLIVKDLEPSIMYSHSIYVQENTIPSNIITNPDSIIQLPS